jgi:hypothetical protein
MTEGTEFKLVTFDRTSAKDMLAKLHREIARMESPTKQPLAADHVINAFWTAWHLHAWIYAEIKERPDLKAAVLKYRGIDEAGIDDQSSFGTSLARRFVPLKICRMIATSSKLVHVELPSAGNPGPDIATDSSDGSLSELQTLSSPTSTLPRLFPMITIMGKSVSATRILKEVEEYWVTLIHECGIEKLE